MRTLQTDIKLYEYDELSPSAKERVACDTQESFFAWDWYNSVYEDAKDVLLDISEFDIHRRTISIDFQHSVFETFHAILKNHGDSCETYKTVLNYKGRLSALEQKFDNLNKDNLDTYEIEQEMEEVGQELLYDLGQDYLSMLRQEVEYLQSEEHLINVIDANEYEFLENGEVFND